MGGLWTIARQTFVRIVRTKTVWVFVLVLTVILVALPHNLEGDGTLAGRIRAFLSYSTTVSAVLLSILTLFLAVDLVSADVRSKTVFSVVAKPVARWQYILGRWLGVVMLDALLLAIVAADIYMVAQDLRGGKWRDPMDRLAVETEVFTARKRITPEPFDEELARRVERRIKTFREETPAEYKRLVEALAARYGDQQTGLDRYYREIHKQELQKLQSVAPWGTRTWSFEGITIAGESLTGPATVGKAPVHQKRRVLIRFECDELLLRHLLYSGPLRVGQTEAIVWDVGEKHFDAAFTLADAQRAEIAGLKPGSTIDIRIDPTLQLSYQARASGELPGHVVKNSWHVTNRSTGIKCYYLDLENPPRTFVTIPVPSRAVGKDGELVAQFFNRTPSSLTILQEDVSVLCPAGGFAGNFFRVMVLILCQLMFLAALGVMAGSFLSFAVACLLAFGMLPFSLARGFLTEALALPKGGWTEADPLTAMGHIALKVMSVPLPDFASTNRGDALVDGMVVTWGEMAATGGFVLGVQTAVILAVACVVFTKRELARVQVA